MSDWQTCAVRDSFVKGKVGRQNQIPAKDIADVGQYPVVDQGQDFIAGYCDDVSKLITLDLPFIIFGDHTRCFKYVDFPFVLGADGTKILMPNKEFYYPKFYYYALLALEIPSRGYNRHFKSLKEQSLPLPRLSEQKKIAHILSTVQRAIEAQERIIQITTELLKSMLHQLMTAQISVSNGDRIEGSSGKDRGMIEGVPDGWAEVEFENFTTLQRGKDLTRAQFRKGTVPVAGSNGIIGYHDTAVAKAPGITVGRSGSAGKVTVYNEDFWPHNTSLYVREFHGNDPHFAGYLLESLNLSRFKTGASVPTLDRNSFKTLLILVPPLPEQKKIAYILSTIQQKIDNAQYRKRKLQDLFHTLLHELMTAKTRVHELTFNTSN